MKVASSTIFVFTLLLLSLGVVMLVSASTGQPEARRLVMQPIWCTIGLVACGLANVKDYQFLRKLAWPILVLAVGLLVLVWVPHIGVWKKGAYRWLNIGGFTMQPSEFSKLALILVLAHYGAHFQRHMDSFWKGMVFPGLILSLVVGLIFLEPDVGTAMLLAAVGGMMMVLAGTRLAYVIPPVLIGIALLTVFIINDPVRSERIHSWLNLEETKMDKGFQAYQAMVAMGSGGLTGLGLGNGRQKLGFIPEHHTDFIFSIIGEELGLIATLAVVLAFMGIVISGVYVAWNARETFGMLLAGGITLLIGLQAMINIGVVTGALPNKGLSLPFISYGGSNLVIMLTCVGLLINVARHGVVRQKRNELSLLPGQATAATLF